MFMLQTDRRHVTSLARCHQNKGGHTKYLIVNVFYQIEVCKPVTFLPMLSN